MDVIGNTTGHADHTKALLSGRPKQHENNIMSTTATLVIAIPPGKLGLTVNFLDRNRAGGGGGGAIVETVLPSCAFKDEVRGGDRIVAIDEKKVYKAEDLGVGSDRVRQLGIVRSNVDTTVGDDCPRTPLAKIDEEAHHYNYVPKKSLLLPESSAPPSLSSSNPTPSKSARPELRLVQNPTTNSHHNHGAVIITIPPGKLGLAVNFLRGGGAVVESVLPSCAFKGEVGVGDCIVTIDGKKVREAEGLSGGNNRVRRLGIVPVAKLEELANGENNGGGAKQTTAARSSSVSSSEEKKTVPEISKEELEGYAKAKSELERRAEAAASGTVIAEDEQRPSHELPRSASVAAEHFATKELERAEDVEAVRAVAQEKEPTEPLPVDYFADRGNEYLAAKKAKSKKLAWEEMPVGVKYFTEKAEEEKRLAMAEQRALSEATMSDAARHFKAAEEEKLANLAAVEAAEMMMPAAIQKFTLEANAVRDAKKEEIRALHDNPPPMPEGQAYFTNRMNAETERRRSEIRLLKDNPPPASVAAEHFKVEQSQRQLRVEAMLNEPAPPAIQHFTQKAKEEQRRAKEAVRRSSAKKNGEPALAIKHFAEMEKQREAEMRATRRAESRQEKVPVEPLPVDYFAKQGEKRTEDKRRASKERAEKEMPVGVKYFTNKAEEEKASRCEERRRLSEASMSDATKHFKKLDEEKKADLAAGEAEIMPVAVRKFTLEAREAQDKKRREIREMRKNPPPMPEGQAYFTNRMNAETERRRSEIRDTVDNPPPASVATEYFKVKRSQRQLEIEAMTNEPAPPAIEYFTQKAKEDARRSKEAMERSSANNAEPALATKYFAEMEIKREAEMEAARRDAWKKHGLKRAEGQVEQSDGRHVGTGGGVDWAGVTKQKAPAVPVSC